MRSMAIGSCPLSDRRRWDEAAGVIVACREVIEDVQINIPTSIKVRKGFKAADGSLLIGRND